MIKIKQRQEQFKSQSPWWVPAAAKTLATWQLCNFAANAATCVFFSHDAFVLDPT